MGLEPQHRSAAAEGQTAAFDAPHGEHHGGRQPGSATRSSEKTADPIPHDVGGRRDGELQVCPKRMARQAGIILEESQGAACIEAM
jgi:hypothetical protein